MKKKGDCKFEYIRMMALIKKIKEEEDMCLFTYQIKLN